LTEPLIEGPGARVMSLRDGAAKMSKSDPSDNSRINLMDDADAIAQKIRRAKTDPEPLPEGLEDLRARPEADNLVGIYAALAGVSKTDVLLQYGGRGFGDFKPALADLAVAVMGPIGERMRRLMDDPGEIDAVLRAGAERARAVAEPVIEDTKRLVGFWPG
jgi:tryptophanyl-tRNA synthetase